MTFWLQNTKDGHIVCAFKVPRGYSAREAVNNWLERAKIEDKENYKILYKNPFTRSY